MENNQRPTLGNGKVCYIEIPAIDINTSADFYKAVFGWHIRQRGDGHLAFDDTVGEVSGTWIDRRGNRPWRQDRATDWRGRTRDHRQV